MLLNTFRSPLLQKLLAISVALLLMTLATSAIFHWNMYVVLLLLCAEITLGGIALYLKFQDKARIVGLFLFGWGLFFLCLLAIRPIPPTP